MSEVKKEIKSHLKVSFAWLILVTILSLFRLRAGSFWFWLLGTLFLWLGTLVGTFLLDIDHLIYWFFTHPEKEDSQKARKLWQGKEYKELLLLLGQSHDSHTRLIFHSALFQIIFLIFTLYIFTSGGSYFGSGLAAGINLHLLKDEWEEYFEKKYNHLNDWLFWQLKRKIGLKQQKNFIVLMLSIFLGLSLLV